MNPTEVQILPFEINYSINDLKLVVETTKMQTLNPSDIQHTMTSWYLIDVATSQTVDSNLYSQGLYGWYADELKPQTTYKIRVIYHTSQEGLTRTEEISFTTPEVEIKQPDFELSMSSNNSELGIALVDAFKAINTKEEQVATTYIIRDIDGNVLYEKYKDTNNLRYLDVTNYLKSNTGYFIEVEVHTEHFNSPRKIKYIKTPVFTLGDRYDITTTVAVYDNLLPIITGTLPVELDKTIKQVNLKVLRRGYPKDNITLLNRFLRKYENQKLSEIGYRIEEFLTENDMREIMALNVGDKMGLWVHPWIFILDIYFTDGSKAESRPIYKRIPLRVDPGIIMQIGKEYPVFILNNYKHNATWDTVDTITWIVINAYGEKIVEEKRSTYNQTFSLEPYILKGDIVKGMFYYVQAVVTTKAGITTPCKTGNEKYHRVDRKGVPFVIENVKIKEPYVTIDSIEPIDQNLFNIHLHFSKFEVNHNPYNRDIEHSKTTIRLFDITNISSNSNIQEKLVYEAEIDPSDVLTLSRSKEIAPEFSTDNENVGIYYNREYRIEVHYIGSDNLISHVGSKIFYTPHIPETVISAPVIKESYIMPTGDIHIIVAELDESLATIKNNSIDTIKSTTFNLYKGTELVYTKDTSYDKFKFAIKDFDSGLLCRLEENVEYWLDVQYHSEYGVTSPVTSVRFILGQNPITDLDIIQTYLGSRCANFKVLNTSDDLTFTLKVKNEITSGNVENGVINLNDLYPNTEYTLTVGSKEVTFITKESNTYSKEELISLNEKWEIEYDHEFKGDSVRTVISPALLHYKVSDNLFSNFIRFKSVSIHLSEPFSNPIYERVFDSELVNDREILEDIKALDFYTKEVFYIKVRLGLSKSIWLPEKVITFTVKEFDKMKCVSEFIWSQDDFEYLDKPILDSIEDKDNVMYPDSNTAKDRVLKLGVTMPKHFMEYVDHIGVSFNTKYGPYTVNSYLIVNKPAKNYKGKSLFFLLPYNDNILYSDFRDLTTPISTKPMNIVPIIVFKDGTKISF